MQTFPCPFAFSLSRRDVWERTTNSRLTRDRTVFSKPPHDYYWPEYTTLGYELVNGNAHHIVRGAQRIEPVTDGVLTSCHRAADLAARGKLFVDRPASLIDLG